VCGIAGVFNADGRSDVESVRAQLETLDHRGPDSWGIHPGQTATVGQTRLAIIDLVTGDPPITGEDGVTGVALNGEIYNFQSLREDLRAAGHQFRTAGDTEVIAHLAEDCEPVELASRLDGMFAFAVSDDVRKRLVLGRDRVGKKPLYYWSDGTRVVFGSELKSVLAHPDVPRRLDRGALLPYLTFGYVPTPRTFFEGIHSVPPGHVLVAEAGSPPQLHQYWAPPLPGVDGSRPLHLSLAEAAGHLRATLTSAVRRRLVADVPIGAFLSGGVDSSAVVATMAELLDHPVRTFTIGFEDRDGFDERRYARLVAERFGTDHVEFVVQPDAVDLVERLVHHYDEPFGDASAVPTYLLSELTRKHVTVALCGDGSDELFGGYERFSAALLCDRYRRLPGPLRDGLARSVEPLPRRWLRGRVGSAQRFLRAAGQDPFDAYLDWVRYFDGVETQSLAGTPPQAAIDEYRVSWEQSEGAELLDRLLNLNLRTYLLDDLLPKVDRTSMAHALEVRSPFLDAELLSLAFRLPPRTKTNGFARKRVLREAMTGVLPDEILRRRKRGFGVPLDRWFREDLKGYVQGRLLAPTASVGSLLDASAVAALWESHQRGEADHGLKLWALLTLEVFLQKEGW
jgi:asparagine synthase (glutamine-hydrolysing)